MVNYRVDIAVDRPAADVFPYLADIHAYPQWMGGNRAEPISDGPMRTGYRYRYFTDEGEFDMEVTDLQPGRGITARSISGPFRWAGTFSVVDEGEGRSRVTSEGSIRLGGIRRLMEPLAGGEVRRGEQAELDRLKALAEGREG